MAFGLKLMAVLPFIRFLILLGYGKGINLSINAILRPKGSNSDNCPDNEAETDFDSDAHKFA